MQDGGWESRQHASTCQGREWTGRHERGRGQSGCAGNGRNNIGIDEWLEDLEFLRLDVEKGISYVEKWYEYVYAYMYPIDLVCEHAYMCFVGCGEAMRLVKGKHDKGRDVAGL